MDDSPPAHLGPARTSRRGEAFPVLLLAGTGFLQAYAGTLYLARELQRQGCDLTVWVSGPPEERPVYEGLGLQVMFHEVRPARGLRMRWQGLRRRWAALRQLFRHRKVVVTEGTFLFEAAAAKLFFGRRSRYLLYTQELQLFREAPQLKGLRMREFFGLARLADRTVDVEPNRARERMRVLRLARAPLVLRNTLPKSAVPARAPAGTLAALAGTTFPPGVPILIHMGGVGREKPLERVVDAVATCPAPVFFLAFCNAKPEDVLRLRGYAAAKLAPHSFAILGPRGRNELLAAAWEADAGIVDYSLSVENNSNQRYCAPTKLYEFMAMGLAVVGSDGESLLPIVHGEGIGKCASSGTTDDLGRALADVVMNPGTLRAMKARSLAAFQERHCYEVLCTPVVREIVRELEGPPAAGS
ncbi:MAG: hypothetical protein U1F77_19045 [Kiritimatiellia bacterium]